MLKRVISFSLAIYFITVALSPLWGIHVHDITGLLKIHAHEQPVVENTYLIELDTFAQKEAQHIENDHPESHNSSISILMYLFGQKTKLNTSTIRFLPVKYFSSSSIIDCDKKLSNPPLFLQYFCNNQTFGLVNRINSNSILARAPPFNT